MTSAAPNQCQLLVGTHSKGLLQRKWQSVVTETVYHATGSIVANVVTVYKFFPPRIQSPGYNH